MVNKIAAHLLDGLFPHYCALCGLRSGRPVPLCSKCEGDLPANQSCCRRCATPLPITDEPVDERWCGSCLQHPPPFHRVIAPWLYGEELAFLIQRWKYGKQQYLTGLLAYLWHQRAQHGTAVDALVPVPLHWRKRWQRGFNQSQLLGQQLRATSGQLEHSELNHRMVRRTRATPSQSGMNAGQRAGNIRGAFTVQEPCDNLRIAIVDDVLTTGATAAEVASTLLAAGASHVEVWCLARTPPPGS